VNFAGRRRLLVLLITVALLLGVGATTWRARTEDSSLVTWAAAVVTLLVSGGLIGAAARRGWLMSIATVTGALFFLAFWLKWVLADPPLVYLHPVRYDADGAIRVTAVFATCFALSWWGWTELPWQRLLRGGERGASKLATRPGPREVWLVFSAGMVLLVTRVVLAKVWDVGVPGKVPKTIPIPLLLAGIYYLSTYAPLILSFYVLRARQVRLRTCGVALLVGYAGVGVVLGVRSYAVSAALVLFYYYASHRHEHGQRAVARRLVMPAVIVVAAVFSLWLTLQFRSNGASGHGVDAVVGFVSNRIGGLNFLSPVLPVVQDTGTTLSRLSESNWDSFLLVDVYGYPPDSVNGVAGTLLGLAYASAGSVGVVLAALVTGTLAGSADRLLRSRAPLAAMCHLGAVLAWLNLLLEGTVKPAVIMLTVFIATAFTLELLDRQSHPRPAPHERGRERIDHQ
jgi:hypothetical protein